jgi:hypothetical protein
MDVLAVSIPSSSTADFSLALLSLGLDLLAVHS